jgi:hypothetical protein
MDFYHKYLKYKAKYLELKGGDGNKKIKLYHGSPFRLDIIKTRTPRGDNEFNSQTGVYLTDDIMEAMLYSLVRDKERINKGWGIKRIDNKSFLILRNDLFYSKYKLNNVGYLHEYETNIETVEQNPMNSHEYIIKNDIIPTNILDIYFDKIKDNIKYVTRDEFYKIFSL